MFMLSYRELDERHIDDGAATACRAAEARRVAVVHRGRARRHADSDPGRRLDGSPADVPTPAGHSLWPRRHQRQAADNEDENTQPQRRPGCHPRLIIATHKNHCQP